ncbi:AIPR family protein [Massilia sp. Dwa41.01b]|uniref:MZA anti-phage system associated AIPR family protein MzaE n=1 Tax=unclassified Massilia TaxID=2609279 RepID=UPI001601BCBD|nr:MULTISPECIES: MZA anti-phage system associated AIPR family protein MzaE [unclassified Massilia]QNA87467.1 AIPR family protein [Massilia sp. Dwa41.01b]QNA98373.1 AIPR family protein [Massilia sp. Se16.2.3]
MELIDFLHQTQHDVRQEMAARAAEPGGETPFAELVFTEVVTRHMSDIGMTFEPEICHYSARVGEGILKLSGYALSEDVDQLDLYVSLYEGCDDLVGIPDSETTRAAEQCSRFLNQCVSGTLSAKMDESHDAFALVQTIEKAYAGLEQIRIYVLTDRKAKTRNFQARQIQGKTVKLEVMDIERLFNHWQGGKPRDELVVNFSDVCGSSLPCVWVSDSEAEYDYAMTVFPGEALRFLYEKYGPRILEANVRSFLSQTNTVNKGIRDTLRDQPERFMAYNNGVVIVADEAHLERAADGSPGIAWLKGMQVVNGGQTMASIFFTKKKFAGVDLRKVRVPAKVIVLRRSDEVSEDALIADISRYANSQSAVKGSDHYANKPFHVQMEKLAMTTYCPDGVGRWYYERAAGSYKVMLDREAKSAVDLRRLQDSMPPSRKLTKTDFAKYLCGWMQLPDLVSLGGQKAFPIFMKRVMQADDETPNLPDAAEYRHMIAKVIIFKTATRLLKSRFPAFKANVTAYTVAVVSLMLGDRISLDAIWQKQGISTELGNQIVTWSDEVNDMLHRTANGRMLSEWAKKKECWEMLSKHAWSNPDQSIPEVAASRSRPVL